VTSLAEVVDRPADWIGTLDGHLQRGLRRMADADPERLIAGLATILLRPDLLAPPPLEPWEQRLLDLHLSGLTHVEIARQLQMAPEDVEQDLTWLRRNVDAAGERIFYEAEKLVRRADLVVGLGAARKAGSSPRPETIDARKRLRIGTAFLDELHDLLCAGERYQEERASLVKEYKAGQSTFVASVAVVLAPHLGAGVQFVAAAVAVALSVIGQVGLRAWCASQSERRNQVGPSPPGVDP
jgi:hypothetical protein